LTLGWAPRRTVYLDFSDQAAGGAGDEMLAKRIRFVDRFSLQPPPAGRLRSSVWSSALPI